MRRAISAQARRVPGCDGVSLTLSRSSTPNDVIPHARLSVPAGAYRPASLWQGQTLIVICLIPPSQSPTRRRGPCAGARSVSSGRQRLAILVCGKHLRHMSRERIKAAGLGHVGGGGNRDTKIRERQERDGARRPLERRVAGRQQDRTSLDLGANLLRQGCDVVDDGFIHLTDRPCVCARQAVEVPDGPLDVHVGVWRGARRLRLTHRAGFGRHDDLRARKTLANRFGRPAGPARQGPCLSPLTS